MKILFLSDLHFEFYKRHTQVEEFINSLPEADVCSLAGDIDACSFAPYQNVGLRNILKLFCDKYKNVVYVNGNHEFYYVSQKGFERELSDMPSNFHWLKRKVIEIDGKFFAGTTLWFPLTEAAVKNTYWLTDFQLIVDYKKWVFEENKKDVEFLKREVKNNYIVLTHHLPSEKCVDKQFKGDPFNCYFVCDIEKEVIIPNKPAIWQFGHTHCSFDFDIEKTRMICNPFGYKNVEENKNFNKNMVIEI